MAYYFQISKQPTLTHTIQVMALFEEGQVPVILLGSRTGTCSATGKLLRWMTQGRLVEQTLPTGLPLCRYSFEYTKALAH